MHDDYNAAIIDEFRANNGKLSGQWEDSRLVLLNSVGARSGKVRTVPLAYLQQDDRIYVVGSAAGSEKHPDWYHNLLANPEVTYELGNGPIEARATLLQGPARQRAWRDIVAELPFFADYEARVHTREIPVFALDPAS